VGIPNAWTIHENGEETVYVVMNSERVRELREEKGMSRRDLAGAAGVSVETARRIEREAPVTFRTGRAVADALGVEPSPSLGRVLGRE
jgi:transcriptional regulator with XRE-family HTH domain